MTFMGQPRHRRLAFELPDDLAPAWNPALPEFAAAANAVSLMMPYVEPFVIRAAREHLPHLETSGHTKLANDVRVYVRQEAEHQTQHRSFNAVISRQVSGVGALERLMAWTYRALWNRGSQRFHLAFATASESAAYGVARWVERNHGELFAQANPAVASLYLWHLAEEVEHKDVAYDLYDARYRSRLPLGAAMVISVLLLALFTVLGTTLGLAQQRRLFHPLAWVRLTRWALGFMFSELPNMFAACLPGHHPSDFTDPVWFELYLLDVDATIRQNDTTR